MPSQALWRRSALTLFLLVACSESSAPPQPPPPEVKVIVTEATDVPIHLEFVGETAGEQQTNLLVDLQLQARLQRAKIRRNAVDLPQPEGPSRDMKSPSFTVRCMSFRATTSPLKVFSTWLIRKSGARWSMGSVM